MPSKPEAPIEQDTGVGADRIVEQGIIDPLLLDDSYSVGGNNALPKSTELAGSDWGYDNISLGDGTVVTNDNSLTIEVPVPKNEDEIVGDEIEPFGSKNDDFLLVIVLAGLVWYIYSKRS